MHRQNRGGPKPDAQVVRRYDPALSAACPNPGCRKRRFDLRFQFYCQFNRYFGLHSFAVGISDYHRMSPLFVAVAVTSLMSLASLMIVPPLSIGANIDLPMFFPIAISGKIAAILLDISC